MPPKGKGAAKSQKGQEKAAIKAKQKVAEDKTFGLKNKNKSKQVQKIVQSVQKSAVQQPKRGGLTPAEAKKAKRAEEEAREKELQMLFRVAPDEKKKAKELAEKEAAEKAAAEAAGGDAYAHLKGEEEYRFTAEDFEPIETDDSRIEEKLQRELEELREKLEKTGGGTKVNPESFALWKEKQRKAADDAQKKSKEKMAKTGKWTGRALFEHNKDLFVDDEDADEEIEREDIPDEEAAGGAIDASLFDGDDLAVEDAEDEEDDE